MEERSFKVSAVVLGLALTIGGSLLLGGCIGIVLAAAVFGAGTPPDRIQAEILELIASTPLLLVFLAVGGLCAGLGGYVAARVGAAAPLTHAAAVGLTAVGLGLLFSERGAGPLWFTVVDCALTLVGPLAGGALAARGSRPHVSVVQPGHPAQPAFPPTV